MNVMLLLAIRVFARSSHTDRCNAITATKCGMVDCVTSQIGS